MCPEPPRSCTVWRLCSSHRIRCALPFHLGYRACMHACMHPNLKRLQPSSMSCQNVPQATKVLHSVPGALTCGTRWLPCGLSRSPGGPHVPSVNDGCALRALHCSPCCSEQMHHCACSTAMLERSTACKPGKGRAACLQAREACGKTHSARRGRRSRRRRCRRPTRRG